MQQPYARLDSAELRSREKVRGGPPHVTQRRPESGASALSSSLLVHTHAHPRIHYSSMVRCSERTPSLLTPPLTPARRTGSPHATASSSRSRFIVPFASRTVSARGSAGGRRRDREARQYRQSSFGRVDQHGRAPAADGGALCPASHRHRLRLGRRRARPRAPHRRPVARQRRLEGLRPRQSPVHLLARGDPPGEGARRRLEEST